MIDPFLYTRTGDDGNTSLLGSGRVPKYHPRIEALGCLDEASAMLGLARSLSKSSVINPILVRTQKDLQSMMGEIAATPENAAKFSVINSAHVQWLEEQMESLRDKINKPGFPKEFVIPGNSTSEAVFAVARTVVRRAERRVTGLLHSGEINNLELVRYLNRLSSLCFVMELIENEIDST